MDLSDFRSNAQKQKEGVEIPFGTYATIRLRSTSDTKFMNLWSRLMKPHETEQRKQKLPEPVGREILAKAIAQRLVVEWSNMLLPKSVVARDFQSSLDIVEIDQEDHWDYEMVEIPYSKKAVFTILNHENYGEFRGWIMQQANEVANFQDEDFEGDLGNLKAISSSKTAGESTKKS